MTKLGSTTKVLWHPVPYIRMRPRHKPSREENQRQSRHFHPPQQLNNGDKNAGLNERRKNEPFDDMCCGVAMRLPKAQGTWWEMKEPNNRRKQRGQSVVVTEDDKDEYKWRIAARKKCVKLCALAHKV
jgi:hypothetical protein